jgi:transposase InsO family protein
MQLEEMDQVQYCPWAADAAARSSGRASRQVATPTVPDAKAACPLDRLVRQFRAERPKQLWVADFTYVSRPGRASPTKRLHLGATDQKVVEFLNSTVMNSLGQHQHRLAFLDDVGGKF